MIAEVIKHIGARSRNKTKRLRGWKWSIRSKIIAENKLITAIANKRDITKRKLSICFYKLIEVANFADRGRISK